MEKSLDEEDDLNDRENAEEFYTLMKEKGHCFGTCKLVYLFVVYVFVFWGNKEYGSVLRPKRLLGIDAGSSGGDSPRPDRRVEIRREKMLPI